jgi:hypothetical protein
MVGLQRSPLLNHSDSYPIDYERLFLQYLFFLKH